MTAVRLPESPALSAADQFVDRHIGGNPTELAEMLRTLGHDSLGALVR